MAVAASRRGGDRGTAGHGGAAALRNATRPNWAGRTTGSSGRPLCWSATNDPTHRPMNHMLSAATRAPAVAAAPALAALCLATALGLASPSVAAQVFAAESTRIGAFAGAMRWCEDHHDGKDHRYRAARRRAAAEIDGMNRLERSEVMRARDSAYRRGAFFSQPLDVSACRDLLRASEWARFR